MRFFDRIRNRTALFFCLASLIPLSILAALLCSQVYSAARETARELDRALVAAVRSTIDDRLALYRDRLSGLAYQPSVQSVDRARQLPALQAFVDENAFFFKVLTFDRVGRLLNVVWRNRYRGEENLVGRDILASDPLLSPALKGALDEGEPRVTAPFVDSFSQPVLYLALPVRHFFRDDRTVGAVAGAVLLSGHQVQALLDRAHLPTTAYACVLDGKGQILARRGAVLPADRDDHTYPMDSDGRAVDYLSQTATSVLTTLSGTITIEGRPVLATAARLESIGLTLVVGRPKEDVLAPAGQARLQVLSLSLLGVVFALVLGVILSGSFVRPVLALVEGIRKVGAGHLSHRVAVGREDEMGTAASAFNEMAAELEKQRLIEQIWSERWQGRD